MDETIKLIRMAHQGNREARNRLVVENTGLVWSIVRRFAGRGYEMEDLFQIGSIGLIKAIDKFNLNFDVRFSTYAVPMITGEIKRFLRDDGMIKVSRSIKEMGSRIRAERERLTYELGREPDIRELSNAVGASPEEVAASIDACAGVESLYRTINRNDENDILLIERTPDPGNHQENMLDRLLLEKLLEKLDKKEQELILRRYYDEETQSQIAAALHISQVQVSRLEKKILNKMRHDLDG